jgi:hypothetical protein
MPSAFEPQQAWKNGERLAHFAEPPLLHWRERPNAQSIASLNNTHLHGKMQVKFEG